MTFLAPTSAILAAAVVLPLLVAMYLLKLRRRPLRVSSILLWEKFGSDIQVNVPLARPRASWLLLLHVLIAAALIAAVGRPAIPGAAGSGGKLIVVIDRSASMSALDSTRDEARITRLDEAKERAAAAIQQAAASSAGVAVVTFGSAAQVVREFSPDAAQAVRAVREIAPSDQPGNFVAAADVVRALVSSLGESESGPGVDVVLFSDGVFEASADSTEAGGPAMRLVRVGAPPANTKENLGVVSLAARRIESDLEAVEVFARLQNAAREPRIVPVSFAVSGQVMETRTVTVPGAGTDAAGELAITFACRPQGRQLATVSLGVDPSRDLLASDNSASLLLKGFVPPRIVYVTRPSAASAANGESTLSASFLLQGVLAELRLGELNRVTQIEYEELVATGQLRFFDAVLFEGSKPSTSPPLPSLSINAGLPELELLPPTRDGPGRPVLAWTRSHPLLEYITLDGIIVSRSRPIREVGPESAFAVLARGETGPLLLARDRPGDPRRIVLTFDLADSNWPIEPSFAIFLNASVAWLTSTSVADASRFYTTIEPVTISPTTAAFERVGGNPVEPPITPSPAGPQSSLGVLDRAGVYLATGSPEASAPLDPVAVNLLNPLESAAGTSDRLIIGRRTLSTAASTPAPLEIWWWFLVAALGFLIVEWFVFARSARA